MYEENLPPTPTDCGDRDADANCRARLRPEAITLLPGDPTPPTTAGVPTHHLGRAPLPEPPVDTPLASPAPVLPLPACLIVAGADCQVSALSFELSPPPCKCAFATKAVCEREAVCLHVRDRKRVCVHRIPILDPQTLQTACSMSLYVSLYVSLFLSYPLQGLVGATWSERLCWELGGSIGLEDSWETPAA